VLVDTDVMIWAFRGNKKADEALARCAPFHLSAVSYMELIQGIRNKAELADLRAALSNWDASIVYIDEQVSTRAIFLMEKNYLSHSLKMGDALIAATAIIKGWELFTGNEKHFQGQDDLKLKKFRP
jgi:predicted nucleic acid-binding protein